MMSSPAFQSSQRERFTGYIELFTVLGLCSYQLLLCFLHTHFITVNNGIVGATEGLILGLAAYKGLRKKTVGSFALPMLVIAYFIIMFVIRDQTDPQGIRNLMIVYIMFCLGAQIKSQRELNIIVWWVIILAAIFAFWEYFLTDSYLNIFNILKYYIARGVVTLEQQGYLNTNLYTSGLRPSGRTILPFLGDQRVSSIFLEPVSEGNFAAILCMFALSFDTKDWRKSVPIFGAGIFFIIAGDSRFASLIVCMLILARFIRVIQSPMLLYLIPMAVVVGQAYFASLMLADWRMDDLPGRLTKSGMALLEMEIPSMFGIGSVDELYDMGIPYSLVVFGVPLCVLLWSKLVMMRFPTEQGYRMRAMLTLYCIGLLMISGTSFYSAKTAGLLWFMMGALYAARTPAVADQPQAPDAQAPHVQTAATH